MNLMAVLLSQNFHFRFICTNVNKSNSVKPRDKHTKEIKRIVCNKASELYKEFLRSYFVKYKNFFFF